MANIQQVAERIFRHVEADHLPAGYALIMGALIDAYNDDPNFREWVDGVTGSAIEKLIACAVRKSAWNNPGWLREYVREVQETTKSKENAA